jgi:hypothetical protein
MSPKNQDQAAYTNLYQFKSGYNYLSHVPDCQDLDDKLGEYNGHVFNAVCTSEPYRLSHGKGLNWRKLSIHTNHTVSLLLLSFAVVDRRNFISINAV